MTNTVDKVVTNLEMDEFESFKLKKGSAPSLTSIHGNEFVRRRDSRLCGGLYSSFGSISYH